MNNNMHENRRISGVSLGFTTPFYGYYGANTP